jgi:hypothetical protein
MITAFAASAVAVLARCDDVSPLAYIRPIMDAEAPDHVDESRVAACRACASGDGGACQPAYETCVSMDSRCPKIFDCLTDSYCWTDFDRNNLTVLPPCATACFSDAGIVSINEIAAAAASLFFCVEPPGACSSVCTNAAADARTPEASPD